jgi:pilus assembly protein CpaB
MELTVPDAPGGALVRRGERAVEVVAAGSPELVVPGARVDVLVTREGAGTKLALQDVEVLAAAAAPGDDFAGARVAATLRTTVRQAVYLTAAQSFAREIRLLPRAAGDRERVR